MDSVAVAINRFRDAIRDNLRVRPDEASGFYTINEDGAQSKISSLKLGFKGDDGVLVLSQGKECLAIKEIIVNTTWLKSCDFIVLLSMEGVAQPFFCEIKSSDNNKHRALPQIKSSKIFFEFVYRSYLHHNRLRFKDFPVEINKAPCVLLHPRIKKPNSDQENLGHLIIREIDPNDGVALIEDAYEFFSEILEEHKRRLDLRLQRSAPPSC